MRLAVILAVSMIQNDLFGTFVLKKHAETMPRRSDLMRFCACNPSKHSPPGHQVLHAVYVDVFDVCKSNLYTRGPIGYTRFTPFPTSEDPASVLETRFLFALDPQ